MEGLGDLVGGSFSSEAFDTSADGSVIVGRGATAAGNEAFLWTASEGMRSLQVLLATDYGLDLTGWQLDAAWDISDDGKTIVGHGLNPAGEVEAWIARLPGGGPIVDCNLNGVLDECELAGNDCNSNGVPDECELADNDCNSNGVLDGCDIAASTSPDCNTNGVPDDCETDCNSNSIPDECESLTDCNTNGTPDACELSGNDCNTNAIPDECEPDCNSNGIADGCEITAGSSDDCNMNSVPDECDLAGGGLPAGYALDFDGLDDHVVIPSTAALRPANNFTVEAWVRLNTLGAPHSVVFHDDGGGGDDSYSLMVLPSGQARFAAANANDFAAQSVLSDQTLSVSQWHHLAGVYDNSVLRIYVDGQETSKVAAGDLAYEVFDFVNIGRRGGTNSPNTNVLDGMVDEVRFWNVPRSQAEIVAAMGVPLTGSELGLVGYWKFDEGIGPMAFDSADAHDGTLINGPVWFELPATSSSSDCNSNGVPDTCELARNDTNSNGIPDDCDPCTQLLYVYDNVTQQLMIVRPDTGTVTPVGLITPVSGLNVGDFAAVGGRLFGLDYLGATVGSNLIEIDPLTGAVISSVPITLGGAAAMIPFEGLAADSQGNLVVSYWTSGAFNTASSNTLGLLALDGSVTNGVVYGTTAPWDIDGLTFDESSGMFIGINHEDNTKDFLQMTYPGTGTVIATLPTSGELSLIGDPVMLDGDIVTFDRNTKRINRHDRNSAGILSWVAYPAQYEFFRSAAFVCVPCHEAVIDCNFNGLLDDCELAGNDCNTNGIVDECDITVGTSADCNTNGIPDDCELSGADCNINGVLDECDLVAGSSSDCNNSDLPDECDIAAGTSADFNASGIPDECESSVTNVTQGTQYTSIAEAIAAAVDGDDLLATPISFEVSPTIDYDDKAITLRSNAQINQPSAASLVLADDAALEAAAGSAITFAGQSQIGVGDRADVMAQVFQLTGTGGLRVRAASVLDVTANGGAQLGGTTQVDPLATLAFSATATNTGAFSVLGGVLVADELINDSPSGSLNGYGDLDANVTNHHQVTLIADTQALGDYINSTGAVTTIQNGTLTITGSLINDGTIMGDISGGALNAGLPRAAGNGLTVLGDYVAGPSASLLMPSEELTLKVGADFDAAIDDPARFDMELATLELIGLAETVQHVEAMGADQGDSPVAMRQGAAGSFVIGTLRLGSFGSTVQFVDLRDNDGQGQETSEAVYVDHLVIEADGTLAASETTIYYSTIDNQGVVENPGQLDQVVDLPGDYDADGDVDLDDYAALPDCMTGAVASGLGLGCEVFDFDQNGTCDLSDFAEFQAAFGQP